MSDFKTFPPKHPTSKLDYVFDWAPKRNDRGVSNWLEEGETILTKTISIVPIDDITIESEALTDTSSSVTVVLSGGILDVVYHISCSITTSNGREDTRTAILSVQNR